MAGNSISFVRCVFLLSFLFLSVSASTTEMTVCGRGFYGSNGYAPCKPCPKGRYGLLSGMDSAVCSGACPTGKYNDKLGMISDDDCKPCPPNTYSAATALTDESLCTACAVGKYNPYFGSSASSACVSCDDGYMGWECMEAEDLTVQGVVVN